MAVPKQTQTGTEYKLVSNFKLSYRNREDLTNLPPGVLVKGSKNVLTNMQERIQARKGYILDGAASAVIAPILASYDYPMHTGDVRNLRAGFLTSAGNDGKLQYRYVDSLGNVSWRDLITGLTSTSFNFTNFWDATNAQSHCLMVNGAASITDWTGGITTYASSTVNTITKEGTGDWASIGFLATGTRKVVINGTEYTYTGGETTTTLTGVTPDPTGAGIVAGDVIHQQVTTTLNSGMTSMTTLGNDLISTLNNQVFVGNFKNNNVYVSKVNSFTDYSFTAVPNRTPGQGIIIYLDKPPVAFDPREDKMAIHCGKSIIVETKQTLSADLSKEAFDVKRLKTTANQAAVSQATISHIKNDSVFITNEPTMDTLGRVEQILGIQQTTNLSDPIKVDFDSYDFTDTSSFYHKYFIYVAVPVEGIVRIYNLITQSWEAPQTLPVSRFYEVDGDLYGHSYLTSESYKLFDGYNDNGNPIEYIAAFSFQNFGERARKKNMNEFFVEGYLDPNTTLNLNINYEIDGCQTSQNFSLDGENKQFVCLLTDNASIGKSSLGKNSLGGEALISTDLPPKFRWIPTFPRINFFETQAVFSSVGIDQKFELLSFGGNVQLSTDENVEKKD